MKNKMNSNKKQTVLKSLAGAGILVFTIGCMKAERIDLDPGSPSGVLFSIASSSLNSTATDPTNPTDPVTASNNWDEGLWDTAVWAP